MGVKLHQIEQELPEIPLSKLDSNDLAVNVILEALDPDRKKIAQQANPFMSPDYWHAKGHKMQTGKSSNENLNQHLKQKNKYGIK